MASLTDSNAHFRARAAEYEVPNDVMNALNLAGVRTGHLASPSTALDRKTGLEL